MYNFRLLLVIARTTLLCRALGHSNVATAARFSDADPPDSRWLCRRCFRTAPISSKSFRRYLEDAEFRRREKKEVCNSSRPRPPVR